jgi:spermidine synthase
MKKLTIIALLFLFLVVYYMTLNPNSNIIAMLGSNDQNKLWVYQEDNLICMSFSEPPQGLRQSCINLDKKSDLVFEYQKKILAGLLINPQPKRVLLIGLGGGTLAKALLQLYPDLFLDIVEINPFVLEAAEKYFFFQKTDKTRVFLEDAFDYLERVSKEKNHYDFIILDAFDANYIPRKLLSQRFFSNLKRVMTLDAVIAINTFNNSQYNSIEKQLIEDNFKNFYRLSGKNIVILAGPSKSKEELSSNGSTIAKKLQEIYLSNEELLSRFD